MVDNAMYQSVGTTQWTNYTWARHAKGDGTTSSSNKKNLKVAQDRQKIYADKIGLIKSLK
jgi:hypothetical protein